MDCLISPVSGDLRDGVILESRPASPLIGQEGEKKKKQAARARIWIFTWNNPDEISRSHLIEYFEEKGHRYIFQLEEGPICKTPHFQGVVQFPNQKTLSALRVISPKISWRICKCLKTQITYCCKEEGRLDGPWYKGFTPPISVAEKYGIFTTLLPWQQELKEELLGPIDPRRIIWYYDEAGNKGKTQFAKHMQVMTKTTCCLSGKGNDMLHILSKDVAQKDITIVIFTFTRSVEGFISYATIESIKDGFAISGKYDSSRLVMKSPHVVCMANFMPDKDKLSDDRWDIRTL